MSVRRIACVAMLIGVMASAAFAQSGSVRGRVLDPQRVTVAEATVTLTAADGSSPKTIRTGEDGTFTLDSVAPGSYVLRVESPGFDPWTRAVAVTGGTATVDAMLQIQGLQERVLVAAPKLEEELPQEIERAGSRVQTITSADIENGGYNDIGQVLQALVPGLYVAPKSGAFDYVVASLQGSRTAEMLWLVDGVRISNRLYNGTTPLDTLPAHMVERIEIIEGGQGVFYGTQGVAGVINVVTKAFTEDANGAVRTGFNTNRGGLINGFARGSGNGHRYVLYGSKDEARGFNSFPENEYSPSTTDRHRSYDVNTFGAKYAYDFGTAVRLSTMYQLSDVKVDTLRPARSSLGQVGGQAGVFNERREHVFSAKGDYTAHANAEVFFKTYYHQWDSYYSESRNAIASGALTVISDREFWGFKDYGLNIMTKLTPTRGVEYFAGYDFQNYSGRDEVLLIAQQTERVNALFGQIRITPELIDRTTLALGVRHNNATNAGDATVWNLTGRHDFTPALFARAGVGTAFRYPDAYQLFAIDESCCIGNPNLKPERSTNVNGSVGGHLRAGERIISLEAIGFYRDITDLIIEVDHPDGSGNSLTANGSGHVKAKGVTIVGTATANRAVSGSLGYTYTKSQGSAIAAGGYENLPGIPTNLVDASFDVHPSGKPFGFGSTINFVGETVNVAPGFGNVITEGYTVVDVSGRYFIGNSRRHRINLRLENLFDKEYTTVPARGFPDTGGSAFVVHNLGTPRTLHMSYSFSY
jgi:outer membrane cobalamin receptor